MSVQGPSDVSDQVSLGLLSEGTGRHRPASKRIIESLTGGLRTAFQVDAETKTSEAFADLIARLRQVEEGPR